MSAASAIDIGEGSRSQLLSRVLGDRRAHSGESGSGVDCPMVDHRGGRRPGVSAVCMYRFDGYGVYACINRLSQRRETYICMYISPGAVFPGVYARDVTPEETRIQLECLFVPGHIHRRDRGYQSGSRLHKYMYIRLPSPDDYICM